MEKQRKIFNERMIKRVRFERDGFLVDVILQNCITKEVLFGASMNREALLETIERGEVVLFSKSRKARWLKGETSGDLLKVFSVMLNCERNHLLVQVLPVSGGVCHRKDKSGKTKTTCFHRTLLEASVVEVNGTHYRIKGKRKEEVKFYFGYGWLSCEELFCLRQIDPRYAP